MAHSSKGFGGIFSLIVVFIAAFLWGAITIRKEVFPYKIVQGAIKKISGSSKKDKEKEKDKIWAKKILDGGYILHFRHASREKWNDVTAFDVVELKGGIPGEKTSFSKAVCLTPQGVEESKLIGAIFKMVNLKVSDVISSPSCRAKQTATNAFGKIDGISNALFHRTAIVPAQHGDFAKELRKLIQSIKPKEGTNAVLVGHGNTISVDGDKVIDINNVDQIDDRDETGFVVLENVGDKIVAHHKFKSIYVFTNNLVELPVGTTPGYTSK